MKDGNKEHVKLHNQSINQSFKEHQLSAYYVAGTALQLLRRTDRGQSWRPEDFVKRREKLRFENGAGFLG